MEAINDDKGLTVSLLPPSDSEKLETSPASIKPGTTLSGRFIVVEKIAEGGTSDIYSAIDKLISVSSKNSHHVALKIAKSPSKSLRQLMINEALASRLVGHHNIAKTHSYHRDQGLDYLSMELIHGETLADTLARAPQQRLSYSHMLSIIAPTCDALAAMHKQEVIHSDIKPSNILITDRGDIKVIDLATARHSATSSRPASIHGLSYYGYTLGYASPETIADRPATAGDDIFSIGCIIYEMLAGKHPYGRKASNKIDKTIQLERPNNINYIQWLLLKKAIHLDGKKRLNSIARFLSLFTAAGKISRYASAAALIVTASFGLSALSDNDAKQWTIEDEQQITSQQIELIKNTDITLMPEALAKLNGDLLDMGGLRLLREDVTERTLEHVQTTLRGKPDTDIDLASLEELVRKLSLTYPDSVNLDRAASDIQFKKQSLREKAIRDYQTFWATNTFSTEELNTLNSLLENLSSLEIPVNALNHTSSTARLERLVAEAKAAYDYRRVVEIARFSNSIGLPIEFRNSIKSETIDIMLAAKQFSAYNSGASQTLGAKAKQHFTTPFVNDSKAAINNAWSDKDLSKVKAQIDAGFAKLGLTKNHEAYQQVSQSLAKKIAFKMDHHRLNGNAQGAVRLQALLSDYN